MRKALAVLMIALLAVTSVFANGGSESTSGDGTTLTWAVWDYATTPYYDALINGYEAANPGVNVEVIEVKRPELDAVISARSTGWSLSRMNAVDRNLLRLALYEMLYVDEVDIAVTIDECVELAKAYGTDESSRFVNGILGRVTDDLEAGVDVLAAAGDAVGSEGEDA